MAKEPSVAWPRVLERSLCYAFGCWEVLDARRPRPVDVVLGRSDGLGSSLFAPVAFPGAPVVQMFDGYFDPRRREPGDEAESRPEGYSHWRAAANAIDLVELENGVTPWTPTEYQRLLFPAEYRDDFLVLHDGVETRGLPPRNRDRLTIGGRTIPNGARVVTFMARSLDRLRGFDRFVAVVARLQREFPDLIAVALGDTAVVHPHDTAHFGLDYPALLLAQTPVPDPSRLWMPGTLPRADVQRLLSRSDLHVYASRPHPASRSMVEAMAAGCLVMAFDSEAAREFVEPGITGFIVNETDIANVSVSLLRDLDAHQPLGLAAKERTKRLYARDVVLPRLASLFDGLSARGG